MALTARVSTSKTWVELKRRPLHRPPKTRIERLSGSSVACDRDRAHRGIVFWECGHGCALQLAAGCG